MALTLLSLVEIQAHKPQMLGPSIQRLSGERDRTRRVLNYIYPFNVFMKILVLML